LYYILNLFDRVKMFLSTFHDKKKLKFSNVYK